MEPPSLDTTATGERQRILRVLSRTLRVIEKNFGPTVWKSVKSSVEPIKIRNNRFPEDKADGK